MNVGPRTIALVSYPQTMFLSCKNVYRPVSGNETNYAMRTHTTRSGCHFCDTESQCVTSTMQVTKCQNRMRGAAVRSKLRMENTVTVHLEVPPVAMMDFSITVAIDQTASMFLNDGDTPPTFEPKFFAGWATR